MSETTTSRQMQVCYERMRHGDAAAREEFFRLAGNRLTALARKIKRDFPGPGKLVDTGDVVSDAYLRLHRSLEQVDPPTVKDFFGLTALKMRQVLLDLCDKFKRPGFAVPDGGFSSAAEFDLTDGTYDPARIQEWSDFHQGVNALRGHEREVVDLLWYHDLSTAEAAEVLGVDVTTVRRRWRGALLQLAQSAAFSDLTQRAAE